MNAHFRGQKSFFLYFFVVFWQKVIAFELYSGQYLTSRHLIKFFICKSHAIVRLVWEIFNITFQIHFLFFYHSYTCSSRFWCRSVGTVNRVQCVVHLQQWKEIFKTIIFLKDKKI